VPASPWVGRSTPLLGMLYLIAEGFCARK